MRRPDKFILDPQGNPQAVRSTLAWARWFENSYQTKERIVRQDKLPNGVFVSTVFLGLDHNFRAQGAPILWESMIFGGPYEQTQWRYHSREEAEKGHAALLAMAAEEWNLDQMLGVMPPKTGQR